MLTNRIRFSSYRKLCEILYSHSTQINSLLTRTPVHGVCCVTWLALFPCKSCNVLLLLYTLFIVEIKTGKMPNNIGPTVNNMLKDIVEKSRYKRKRERKKDGRLVATNRYQSSKHWKTYLADNIYCKA